MDDDTILEIFRQEGIDSEITCPKAFEIAERHTIPKMEIARCCNRHGIKIRGCQLGCFR